MSAKPAKSPPFAAHLAARLVRAPLAQVARVIEQWAWRHGRGGEVGRDMVPGEEPLRFIASERMHLVANDVVSVEPKERQVEVIANVMGLAGATPALPQPYSELQLQRRRARDRSFSHFLNIFDHRALSFFYRITRKYRWPLLAERGAATASAQGQAGQEEASGDPVRDMLIALAGLSVPGTRDRLALDDALLVPQAANFADRRRSARAVETSLRAITGLPLRVVEASPVWMTVSPDEQSKLGQAHLFLGDVPDGAPMALGGSAMIGSAVLDVQHHYEIEIGPLDFAALHRFCADPAARRRVAQVATLVAGIEQRPILRLLLRPEEIPPLRLGGSEAPAMLGRTTWLGMPEATDGPVRDCTVAISVAELT